MLQAYLLARLHSTCAKLYSYRVKNQVSESIHKVNRHSAVKTRIQVTYRSDTRMKYKVNDYIDYSTIINEVSE